MTNPYNKDGVIASYSASGVLLKAHRFGGKYDETVNSANYSPNGGLFISGVSVRSTGLPTLFVRRYDGNRLVLERRVLNGAVFASERGSPALSVYSDNIIFVAGGFQGTATFDTTTLSSLGVEEMFLAQLGIPIAP